MAYTILSQPASRRAYDANPSMADNLFTNQQSADDTFDGVLQTLFSDFMSGDFEVVRLVLSTLVPYLDILAYFEVQKQ